MGIVIGIVIVMGVNDSMACINFSLQKKTRKKKLVINKQIKLYTDMLKSTILYICVYIYVYITQ